MIDVEQHVAGVTTEALAALWERHGLPAITQVAPLGGGGVNPMLRINGDFVVRFNRRDPHLPKLAWEAAIYRRFVQRGAIPGPQVLALDTARDLVPFDTLVLSYIDGVAANTIWSELDHGEREAFSEELGRLCGTIHGLPWGSYGEYVALAGRGTQSVRWADVAYARFRRTLDHITAQALLPPRVLDALITTLNDNDAILNSAGAPALTHTDLQLSNVLARRSDSKWEIAAIIDWEWAIVADPAWEFADLWSSPTDFYPEPEAFVYGYRERHPLPGDFRVRQRLYRLLHHIEMLLVCTEFWPASVPDHHAAIARLLKSR